MIAPKCYQHEKHLFPFHSFCSLFLSKCSRWGILALILFSPTHFGKCNPNPIYTFYCLCWGCATLSLLSKLTLSFCKMFYKFIPTLRQHFDFVFFLKRELLSSSKLALKYQKSVLYKVYLRPCFLLKQMSPAASMICWGGVH